MRIISGDLGGRYIEVPRTARLRPTPERVREAWFSAISADVDGAKVMDLYAGSGALGIEALSRGAAHVHFVEKDRKVAGLLRRTLKNLELENRATVIAGSVRSWIGTILEGRDVIPFDIGLADPPYRTGESTRLLEMFRSTPFATQLWLEHEAKPEWDRDSDWRGRYGDTWLSRFRS